MSSEHIIDLSQEFLPVLEALIFASDEPLSESMIKEILTESEFEEFANPENIKQAIEKINDALSAHARPYTITKVAGGYHFMTRSLYGTFVQKLLKSKSKKRLSQAALETLSIIAYKQPVGKPDIEAIRGVNSGEIVNSLLDRGLITIVGRAETAGRPLLYGTTAEFLRIFGLSALDELPKMKEIDELMQLQPQNLAAELGSAVIDDEHPALPEPEEDQEVAAPEVDNENVESEEVSTQEESSDEQE